MHSINENTLSFTTTAMPRPEIVQATYDSFTKSLRDLDFSKVTLYLNIDSFPEKRDDHKRQEVVEIAKRYFGNVVANMPDTPSFAAAVKWCFSKTELPYNFHLEDDWELLIPFHISSFNQFFMPTHVQQVALRSRGNVRQDFFLCPSLIRGAFCREMSKKMNTTDNPEVVIRDIKNKEGLYRKESFVMYPFDTQSLVVNDTGRSWIKSGGYARGGANFVQWSASEAAVPDQNIEPEISILPVFAEGEKIPKIVHQTFPSKLLPPAIQENTNRLKKINPEWEFKLYDDADMVDFIANNYDFHILDCFNRINPKYGAARADLFRYLLMYKCGGVYIDIKSSFNKPLRNVLKADDRYLLSCWNNKQDESFPGWGLHDELEHTPNGEFQQWHIVAAPGHPFLKAVIENALSNIENYDPNLHGVGRIAGLRITGPIVYTLAIAPLLHSHQHRFVDSESDLGFEYSIFRSSGKPSHKSLFKHHYTELKEPLIQTIYPAYRD